MKKLNQIRNVGAALATMATLGLSPNAAAISLTWMNGPDAGQAFSGGAIVVKALNYDTGTLYNPIPVGTSLGYTGSPGAGVAGGEALLNAQPGRAVLNGRGAEDSWGIVRITQIQSIGSDGVLHDIYNEALNTYELTAMFWGIRDYHLTQVSAGSGVAGAGQVIDGTGMRVDIYSDTFGGGDDFNQTAGPGGRGAGSSTYDTVTDGTLELSLLSTPGFINDNGTFGGTAAEFESNTAAVGYAALDVIGGASAWQFDTNSIGFKGSSGAGFVAGKADQTATDIWFAFTSTQGTNGWDINSNDPMLAVINNNRVPEGGSTLLLLGAALAGLGVVYRRRNQAV